MPPPPKKQRLARSLVELRQNAAARPGGPPVPGPRPARTPAVAPAPPPDFSGAHERDARYVVAVNRAMTYATAVKTSTEPSAPRPRSAAAAGRPPVHQSAVVDLTLGDDEANAISISYDEEESAADRPGVTPNPASREPRDPTPPVGDQSAFVREEREEMPYDAYDASDEEKSGSEEEDEDDENEDAENEPEDTHAANTAEQNPQGPRPTAEQLRQFDNAERKIIETHVQNLYDGEMVSSVAIHGGPVLTRSLLGVIRS
jgi:hypothetical protein